MQLHRMPSPTFNHEFLSTEDNNWVTGINESTGKNEEVDSSLVTAIKFIG